jgi:hypothetical protein
VVTRQISLPRRAKPLEIFGRPLNDVLFSREFRESRFVHLLNKTPGGRELTKAPLWDPIGMILVKSIAYELIGRFAPRPRGWGLGIVAESD